MLQRSKVVLLGLLFIGCTKAAPQLINESATFTGELHSIPLSVEIPATHSLTVGVDRYLLRSSVVNLRQYESEVVTVTGSMYIDPNTTTPIIQVVEVQNTSSSSSSSSSEFSSESVSTSSQSSLLLGKPCGGTAGILCPTGEYCFITDPQTNTGRCAK